MMDCLFKSQKQPRLAPLQQKRKIQRHKSAKKKRPRSHEKTTPSIVIDREAIDDGGNPDCKIVTADTPNIRIARNNDDFEFHSDENEQTPRVNDSSINKATNEWR